MRSLGFSLLQVDRSAYSYELAHNKARFIIINFRERVLKAVAKIPKGKTLTYKEVARRAGSPGAYRAVGNILNKNFNPKIPCHRVIRSDGQVGRYRNGSRKKMAILKREGAF